MVASLLLAVVTSLVAGQAMAQASDPVAALAAARQLYAEASYEEALDRLSRLTGPGPLLDQVHQIFLFGRIHSRRRLVQK